MFNIGTGEIIVIAVVALLVLGPKRLPELARGIGKFLREFRRQTDEVRGVVEREFYKMDQDINTPPAAPPAPVPAPLIQPAQGTVPVEEQQQQLALPMDPSDPMHPDHFQMEVPPMGTPEPAGVVPPPVAPAPATSAAEPTASSAPAAANDTGPTPADTAPAEEKAG